MTAQAEATHLTAQEVAQPNLILQGIVGSTVHGLALDDQDDRDLQGVCIEPPEYVLGLRRVMNADGVARPFEQWTWRTQPEGVRSGPGDTDMTVYSLRKWCRLALAGNPSVLLLLYVPEKWLTLQSEFGRKLQSLAPCFASRYAGDRFLRYMQRQRERLLGERGQMRVKRPELVETHLFDTKYAGHVVRLGYQGIEFLETGRLTLPMREPQRSHVLSIRRGEVLFDEVLRISASLETRLTDLVQSSHLPAEPNRERIDRFLIETYLEWWSRL